MDRSIFTGGPAYLTWNGVTFQMAEDWETDLDLSKFDVKTNLQGRVARGVQDTMAKISFTPIAFGSTLTTLFSTLYPYFGPTAVGSLIFPATDLPAVIQTKSGKTITFSAAALSKMPEINFAPDKVFFGQAELTCLIANNAAPNDTNALVSIANSTYSEPALNTLDMLFDMYTVVYGATSPSAPFDGIETDENGVKFTPGLQLTPRKTASKRTYNMQISDVTAEVGFTPENMTEADWLTFIKMQGTGYLPGKLQGNFADLLTVSGSAVGKAKLAIQHASAEDANLRFTQSNSRLGEVKMIANRRYSNAVSISSTTTNTSTTVTVASTATLSAGLAVAGTGIPGGATISSITNSTTYVLSAAATASGTVNLTYTGLHPLVTLGLVTA